MFPENLVLIQQLEKLVPDPKSFTYFRTGIPPGRLQACYCTFSRNIIIILFIFSNPTNKLARRPTPQRLNVSARKLYRRDQQEVLFRVTLSLPRKSNFEISLTPDLDWPPAPQRTSCFVQILLQLCLVSWHFASTMSFWQTGVLADMVAMFRHVQGPVLNCREGSTMCIHAHSRSNILQNLLFELFVLLEQ